MIALPEQSLLASLPTLTLPDLLDQLLVIFPRWILPSLYDEIFAMYYVAGVLPRVAQEAIQMQIIVNLVSAGLGMAWVPESVQQFQRSGVVYRRVETRRAIRGHNKAIPAVPACETTLVWPEHRANPVLDRFAAFIDETIID